MSGSDSASSLSVWRSRRPHSTPRNFMHENRETSETPAAQPGRRSAGEGSGHAARVYVTEESHCGIVPMNHSNKGGTLVGGEWGGKAADQGEHFPIRHVPDSARDCACPTVGECAAKLFAWPLLIRDKNRMR
jgi:hypothetical protein